VRTDRLYSDYGALEKSVQAVMKLPDTTRLLGGHGPVSTVGAERRNNPFVREILEHT